MTNAENPARERVWQPAIVGAIAAAVLLAAFVVLALAKQSHVVSAFDSAVGGVVRGWRSDALTSWVLRATNLGSAGVAVPVAVIAVLLFLAWRKWAAAILVASALGLGYLLNTLVQNVIGRTRPPQAQALIPLPATYSFPSGHSITSLLIYGVLGFLIWRLAPHGWERVAGLFGCAVLIVMVGLTRVYLGVHWPTDVIGSWLLGGAWLALCCGLFLSWERAHPAR